MAIARFLDSMCLALRASGLWLRYATLQNFLSLDQILPSGNIDSPRKIKSPFIMHPSLSLSPLPFQTEHVAVYWAGATAGTLAAQLIYPTVRKMVYRPQEDRTKKSA